MPCQDPPAAARAWNPFLYVAGAWQRLEPRRHEAGSVPLDEILTSKEVAQFLKVAEKTVSTMAHKELPTFKVRGQWRFRRGDIERWIDEQKKAAQEHSHE